MKAAVIQMSSGTDVAVNIAAASELVRAAAAEGATLIATPEMTHFLQRDPTALRSGVRRLDQDEGVSAFSNLAADLSIHLLIGSLAILRDDGKIANRSLLFAPDGKLTAQYDKIHLFEAALSKSESYREADSYAAGEVPVIGNAGQLSLGLSICYDLRFPSLYGTYARSEVDIITAPAAFTVATGKAHWETLLRSRAIETGAYVIAPAQGGHHEDGRKTWGRSTIVAPWGEVIAKLDHDMPGFACADIDIKKVKQARQRIPAWRGDGS
ncbi:MAG: carbon-nitrogen hydrolase family protein [Litorimonas sp.]